MTATAEPPQVIRDLERLRTLESWCLRWNEELGAWLYFAPVADASA